MGELEWHARFKQAKMCERSGQPSIGCKDKYAEKTSKIIREKWQSTILQIAGSAGLSSGLTIRSSRIFWTVKT
jgi:hypothetical protein